MTFRKLHLFLPVALALAALGGCSDDEQQPYPPRPRPETADQTLLFYLSGQSLSSYFRQNVREIQEAVDRHILWDSRLLIFAQSTYYSYLMECSFDYDGQSNRLDTLERYTASDLPSSIDPACIARVIDDAVAAAPARSYGLILGSHGGGWLPAAYRKIDGFGASEAATLSQGATVDLLHKRPEADATRWFGEQSGTVGEVADWAKGIADSGVEFEYVVFDACFMSNVESLYELRGAARYIVASPCEIMARGIPYHLTLPYLLTDNGTGYDLEGFCGAFLDYYSTTTSTRQSGCLAITRTEELEALAASLRNLNATVVSEPAADALQSYEDLHSTVQGAVVYRPLFFDLRQWAEEVDADPTARTDFLAQFDRTFPPEGRFHTQQFYSGYSLYGQMHDIDYYSGISCSTPTQIEAYAEALRQTPWWQLTH